LIPASPVDKTTLRRQLLQARQTLPQEVWQQQSQRLCDHLLTLPLFIHARTILAYFSIRQEPDLTSLLSIKGKIWGFPRCQGTALIWHCWRLGDPLQPGPYGIREPHPSLPVLTPEAVDLILVPAVACDYQGYRLGYGGGFYDRLLSLPEWQNQPTVGIVFEAARLPVLPVDPWDRPLQAVCTEAGVFPSPSFQLS
jgi:5-formyltetrahydrofolate cyclo-ligase